MSLEENARTPHMHIQANKQKKSLSVDNFIRFIGMTDSWAAQFRSRRKHIYLNILINKRANRALEEDQSAVSSFAAIKIMVWCNIKLLAK